MWEIYHTWMLWLWNQFWFNWLMINFDTWRMLMCCKVNDFAGACYLALGHSTWVCYLAQPLPNTFELSRCFPTAAFPIWTMVRDLFHIHLCQIWHQMWHPLRTNAERKTRCLAWICEAETKGLKPWVRSASTHRLRLWTHTLSALPLLHQQHGRPQRWIGRHGAA